MHATGVELDDAPGLTHLEILRGVTAGPIRAIYLVGENPALSEADATHAREAMEEVDFLVVQDIFLTETAEFADVIDTTKVSEREFEVVEMELTEEVDMEAPPEQQVKVVASIVKKDKISPAA